MILAKNKQKLFNIKVFFLIFIIIIDYPIEKCPHVLISYIQLYNTEPGHEIRNGFSDI